MELGWLDYPRRTHELNSPQHHAAQRNRLNPQRELYNAAVRLPEGERFMRRENAANGFYSCGWLFQPELQFNFNQLFGWLSGADFLRAKAVITYLTKAGVPLSKLKAVGLGEDKPVGDNATVEGRAQNRRIEFVVTGG